ncbi:putative serine protease K12H4.7 [Ostrinia nubilalis]|uniref:putative serine protease K12H4.7 n=1 Tax=Ostrinia furnacalis TaxID=93504 RepID=UPI001039B3D5|nr:putative serine protease K12H4.7 [Ostrinia furnacalis]
MRLLVCFLLLFQVPILVLSLKDFRLGRGKGGSLGSPGGDINEPLPAAKWFKQRLDHSSAVNLITWKQRYFVNDQFYDRERPGPAFLMIGGEGPADPRWMVAGAWFAYAERFKAIMFNLEHRFYGESHPTKDMSTKNLVYLSSSQALGDLAAFIKAMNVEYKLPKDQKWVVFGGSYPGALAAWMRLKYPHLVHGAVSSSGPLLAKVDFREYFKIVVGALREKTGDDQCSNEVKLAHNQITTLMKTQPEVIEAEFRVCKPFSGASVNDIKNFYNSIADDFADLVQYNEDNRIGADKKYRNVTINSVCKMLTKQNSLPAYKKLAQFNSIMLDKSNQTCLDYSYNNMIKELRNVTWGSDEARQWMYQTCTEFGFYQTSSDEVEVFGNNFTVDFFIQQCQDVFGKKFDGKFLKAAVDWTNNEYGGLDLSIARIAYVHGSVDPWHALGMTKYTDSAAPVVYIRGAAHCANMYPPADSDSEELKQAREAILSYLGNWVSYP